MNGSSKEAMIGLLPSPMSPLAFSRPKAFSSLAFIRYPSPLHSTFLPHPTKRREAPKPPPTLPQASASRRHYLAEA